MKLSEVTDTPPIATDESKPSRLSDLDKAPPVTGSQTTLDRFGHGLVDPVVGAGQLAQHVFGMQGALEAGLLPEDAHAATESFDKKVREREQTYQAERKTSGQSGADISRLVGNVLSPVNLAMGAAGGGILPAASTVMRGVVGGLVGGAASGATEPVTGPHYAMEKAGQIGTSTVFGGVLGAGVGALGRAIRNQSPAEIDAFIRDTFSKAIKPTVAGKTTASQTEKYATQARNAIQSIVENKPNLVFTDEAGRVVSGELPRTLEQFSDAIEQTRKGIFQKYDAMAQAAGQQGVKVEMGPVLKALQEVKDSNAVQDFSPELVSYIDGVSQRLASRGELTATEAQDAIQHLNQKLKSFYRNPTHEVTARAAVDQAIANNLRSGLDEAIEKVVAPGYQALKNQYGALKTIEKDVVHRSIVDARQPHGGGIVDRMANIETGAEVIHAITNPSSILSAAAIKGMQLFTRWSKSPNRAVSRIFEAAEQPATTPSPASNIMWQFGAPVIGGAAGDAANSAMGLR